MITLSKNKGIELILYPDNQPNVKITHRPMQEGDEIRLIWSIESSLDLMQLLLVSDALDRRFVKKKVLVIPYLLGARSDRLMNEWEPVALKVISNLINSCNFEKVVLFDPHSDVALQLINNSIVHDNWSLVHTYERENAVLICPDAGAAKKMDNYFKWNRNFTEAIYCVKHRDLQNGKVTLKVLEPEKTVGRNCVIIDDLCDGGATFNAIAEQIQPAHLTLIVSHGLFSKGFRKLLENFDHIITSDSYTLTGDLPKQLTIVKLFKQL